MMHSNKLTAILGSCALVTAVGVLPTNVAANGAQSHAAPLILAQAEQFDDATIDAFAAAQAQIAEIRALYAAQFKAAETDEQRTAIAEEATAEMIAAVEATPDITVEVYDEVIQAANQDSALVERINEAIAENRT